MGYPIKALPPPRPKIISPYRSLPPIKKRSVTIRSTIGKRYPNGKSVTTVAKTGNRTVRTTRSSVRLPSGQVQRASSQRVTVRAKHGYHGIVRKPTRFLVGEAGAEHVRITPLRKQKRMGMVDDFDFAGGLRAGDFY